MADKPTLLLTGDDGYNSLGTRTLVHALRDHYDIWIAATADQQSGMGGKISMRGFEWEKIEVDGIPTLKVMGSPVDCIELAQNYFDTPFDLVISGINWGANMSSAIYSSGTFNAAMRAVSIKVGTKVMAMSWDLPGAAFLHHHQETSVAEYFKYPGETARKVVELAFEHNFWGVSLLNVNFPQQPTSAVKITKIITDVTQCWNNAHPDMPKDKGTYQYGANRVFNPLLDSSYDVTAITSGLISISPCTAEITPAEVAPLLGTELALFS
jgi:5'-nucleotidase